MVRFTRACRSGRLLFVLCLAGSIAIAHPALAQPAGTPVAGAPCARAWRDDAATQTRSLQADCVTDVSIELPDGWTFEGNGRVIQVVDPEGSRFRGGAIEAYGGTATVRNATVDGSALGPGCSRDTAVAGVIFAGASGTISRMTIVDVRRGVGDRCGYGIIIGPAPRPVTATENSIHQPGDAGIVVTGAAATLSDNLIVASGRDGMVLCCQGTSGTVHGNTIRSAGRAGISVEDAAAATLSDNQVSDAALLGITAQTGATLTLTAGNHITGGMAGVVVTGAGTRGTIAGTRITRPARDGIYVQDGAEVTVSRNAIDASGGSGITLAETGTRGTVAGNTVASAAVTGIMLRNGAQAEVQGNTISGPPGGSVDDIFGPFGLRFASGAGGSARDNVISGYLSERPASMACAIAIDLDAGQVDVGQNAFPAPGNTANVCEGTIPEAWTSGGGNGTPVATPRP